MGASPPQLPNNRSVRTPLTHRDGRERAESAPTRPDRIGPYPPPTVLNSARSLAHRKRPAEQCWSAPGFEDT